MFICQVLEHLIDFLLFFLLLLDYPHHTVVFGGDSNCDLDAVSPVADLFNRFAVDNGLFRCNYLSCNKLGSNSKISTYYNESLNCESTIDYFLVNNSNAISREERRGGISCRPPPTACYNATCRT